MARNFPGSAPQAVRGPPGLAGDRKKRAETEGKQVFRKTKMCKFFLEYACERGDQCAYAHTFDEMRFPPDLSRTKMCKNLDSSGFCCDPHCRYAHTAAELRVMPPQAQGARADQISSSTSVSDPVSRTSTEEQLKTPLQEQELYLDLMDNDFRELRIDSHSPQLVSESSMLEAKLERMLQLAMQLCQQAQIKFEADASLHTVQLLKEDMARLANAKNRVAELKYGMRVTIDPPFPRPPGLSGGAFEGYPSVPSMDRGPSGFNFSADSFGAYEGHRSLGGYLKSHGLPPTENTDFGLEFEASDVFGAAVVGGRA